MTVPTGRGWDPAQYARFAAERTRPFRDLAALVRPARGMRVVDLGCGTGELTRELHRELSARATLGLDSSEEMLASSAGFPAQGLRFELGEIAAFEADGAYDLVFSNAALHWVEGHPALFGRLTRALAEGGQLAVQVPANHDYPTHLIGTEIAQAPPFREALGGFVVRYGVLEPVAYSRLLHRLGYVEQTVRLQVYGHELPSREAVLEWVKGSYLTPYRERLTPKLWEQFEGRYRERLWKALKDERPFFYPFKRILIWARRP